jgi:hypothetical protein
MTEPFPGPEADESAVAAWYQAHKDDPDFLDGFEVVPPPKRPRGRPSRRMGARISVRFTPEEMVGIREKAKEQGLTYSEVVRQAVNAQCLKAAS